jgi:hypothetical protein
MSFVDYMNLGSTHGEGGRDSCDVAQQERERIESLKRGHGECGRSVLDIIYIGVMAICVGSPRVARARECRRKNLADIALGDQIHGVTDGRRKGGT